jgi:hypothetical protein
MDDALGNSLEANNALIRAMTANALDVVSSNCGGSENS